MRSLAASLMAALLATPAAVRAEPSAVDRLFASAPALPRDLCGATPSEKEAQRKAASDFAREVDQELSRLRRQARQAAKGDERRIRQEMAERYPEAAKMDRKKLKGMSKEERLAMAQQMMAQGGGMPVPSAPQAAAGAGVAQGQKELTERIEAREKQGRAALDAFLAGEPAATEAARAKELGPLQAEYAKVVSQTIGSDEAERKSWSEARRRAWAENEAREAETVKKYKAAAVRYCNGLAPGWRDAVAGYRAAVLAGRADYDKLEAGQATLAQGTGVEMTPVEPGLVALEALHRYASELVRDPYRFDIRPADR